MNNSRCIISLLLLIFSFQICFVAYSKRVVFDFSNTALSHSVEEKSGDYSKYIFENDGVVLSFNDASWKVSDNYYYLKMKKSSTIGALLSLQRENGAKITRVVFRFHSSSTNNKITHSEDNIDSTLELFSIDDQYYSACDICLDKLYFKSTLGNSLIEEIIVYYSDMENVEVVQTVLELNKNSAGGLYELNSPIVVTRIEKLRNTFINKGVEISDSIYEIYATDRVGGVRIQLPFREINSDFVLPIKGSVLKNLKGILDVSYNVDDSFKVSPTIVCSGNHIVSFQCDGLSVSDNSIISNIDAQLLLDDMNLNKEFLLTNMQLKYIESIPYYVSINSENSIMIPIVDRFNVLNSYSNEGGKANFILSKEYSPDSQISNYVAYPLDKELLTDVDSIFQNVSDVNDKDVIYYNIEGIRLSTINSPGIYIKVSKKGVEKILIKN